MAASVVADVVLEHHLLLRDRALDQFGHRAPVSFERGFHRGDEAVDPEAIAHLDHAAFGGAAGRDDRVQIAAIPVRHPDLIEHQRDQILLERAAAIDFDRRREHPFLENAGGVGGQASRHLAADVGHVPEHRGPSDQAAVAIVNWQQHQPVGRVANRAVALVWIRGEKDVALLDRALVGVEEAADE